MIIITTQCFAPKIGGIESLMTGMAHALAEKGEEVLVLADGIQTVNDKKVKYIIKRFKGWKPIRRIRKARYIEKICKEKKIKAIFADSWKSIEYLKKNNKKILVLAHGTEIPKQYWSAMLDMLRFKRNRIRSSYKNVYKIIANSSYTKDLMNASLEIEASLIEIIHPGIDIYRNFISDQDRKNVNNIIKNRSPVITTLARVEQRKGHIFILKALIELKKHYPDILYLIAGQGPYLKKIIEYTKHNQIENNVKFLGWITEPEKSLILQNSDLFVMTPLSVGESIEGFGMAYIDASFHGLASIGTDSGGVKDAILHNETGLLCEEGNQKMITNSILKLLKDHKLREKMGESGRRRAEQSYSWKNKINEYLKVANLI